jgi:hypothetical protein
MPERWQSYKENNNPKEDYEAKRKYVESREYQIRIKVVDVFENDTNKVVRVG